MNKKQILIVEDEMIVVEDFKEVINDLGHEVYATVSTGEDAISIINNDIPDLILMDISLAGTLNGFETADKINQKFDIPIIYITAYSDEHTIKQAKISTSYGYLSKPIERVELEAAMEIALHKHEVNKKFKTQYKNIPIPTYTWQKIGEDFVLINCNYAGERLLELKDDIIGISAEKLYSNKKEILNGIKRCFSEQYSFKEEIEYNLENNKMNMMINYSFVPPDIISVHKEDITVIRRMEQELKAINKNRKNSISNEYEDKRQNKIEGEKIFKGLSISNGVVLGKAYVIDFEKTKHGEVPKYPVKDKDIDNEIERLIQALHLTQQELSDLEETTLNEIGDAESKIFLAMNMILNDNDFRDKIIKGIKYNKQNAESVVKSVIDYYIYRFSQIENEYIKERSHDIEELGMKILLNLSRSRKPQNIQDPASSNRYIIVAGRLTPQITSSLNKKQLGGIVSEHGSYSSHAGILARGMSIPAVSGIYGFIDYIDNNTDILLDGYEGYVIINPSEDTIDKYKEKIEKPSDEELFEIPVDNIVKMADKTEVELLANISCNSDFTIIEDTNHNIGLYRTEFVFINSESEPTEEEQFQHYKEITEKMGKDRAVTFRTIDIGDDKMPSYIPKEICDNPALGLRGIRLSLHNKNLLINQARALLRASEYGNIKIMFPMITSVREVTQAKTVFEEEKRNLKSEGVQIDDNVEYGIMIETPSSLMTLDLFSRHVDFISVGTNDLVQYLMVTDRNNENVADYYDSYHPAVIKALKMIFDFSKKYKKPVSLCGELNTDLEYLPYLIALGFRRFSINPIYLRAMSRAVSELTLSQCKKKLRLHYNI